LVGSRLDTNTLNYRGTLGTQRKTGLTTDEAEDTEGGRFSRNPGSDMHSSDKFHDEWRGVSGRSSPILRRRRSWLTWGLHALQPSRAGVGGDRHVRMGLASAGRIKSMGLGLPIIFTEEVLSKDSPGTLAIGHTRLTRLRETLPCSTLSRSWCSRTRGRSRSRAQRQPDQCAAGAGHAWKVRGRFFQDQ